jgi:hypothetical protein
VTANPDFGQWRKAAVVPTETSNVAIAVHHSHGIFSAKVCVAVVRTKREVEIQCRVRKNLPVSRIGTDGEQPLRMEPKQAFLVLQKPGCFTT